MSTWHEKILIASVVILGACGQNQKNAASSSDQSVSPAMTAVTGSSNGDSHCSADNAPGTPGACEWQDGGSIEIETCKTPTLAGANLTSPLPGAIVVVPQDPATTIAPPPVMTADPGTITVVEPTPVPTSGPTSCPKRVMGTFTLKNKALTKKKSTKAMESFVRFQSGSNTWQQGSSVATELTQSIELNAIFSFEKDVGVQPVIEGKANVDGKLDCQTLGQSGKATVAYGNYRKANGIGGTLKLETPGLFGLIKYEEKVDFGNVFDDRSWLDGTERSTSAEYSSQLSTKIDVVKGDDLIAKCKPVWFGANGNGGEVATAFATILSNLSFAYKLDIKFSPDDKLHCRCSEVVLPAVSCRDTRISLFNAKEHIFSSKLRLGDIPDITAENLERMIPYCRDRSNDRYVIEHVTNSCLSMESPVKSSQDDRNECSRTNSGSYIRDALECPEPDRDTSTGIITGLRTLTCEITVGDDKDHVEAKQ